MNEIWKVDLRSRKTGCSIETIFSGEHDAACDYIQECKDMKKVCDFDL